MNIRQLSAFVTLADTLNFHKAASILCVTQPALTKTIQGLEGILGADLFYRGPNGTKLTDFGEQILLDTKILLNQYENFKSKIKNFNINRIENIGIGAFSILYKYSSFIESINKLYPDIEVTFFLGLSAEKQLKLIELGEIQMGIIPLPLPNVIKKDFLVKKIFTDQFILIYKKNSSNSDLFFRLKDDKLFFMEYLKKVKVILGGDFLSNLNKYNIYNHDMSKIILKTNDPTNLSLFISQFDGVSLVMKSLLPIFSGHDDLIESIDLGFEIDVGWVWNPSFFNNNVTENIIQKIKFS